MFEEAISKQTAENLVLLGKSKILGSAYLAGGTALALQIGHRISYDLDFFTDQKFKAQIFLKEMSRFKLYQHERVGWGTILGKLGNVKFSLFYYPYPLLRKPISFKNISIADIADISAMKIAAISERGTKRDFVDLYFILQKITLNEVFNFYDRKYQKLSSNSVHIKKSLVYFEDAEKDPTPKMIIPVSWGKVKTFFKKEVKNINA